MPVLCAETTLLRETILDAPSIDDGERSWYVIYTKSRQEKALARDLSSREVPFYLPTVFKENYIRGKVITSHVPLFPSYVFLFGTEDERVLAMTTNRISRVLPVFEPDQLRADLRQIRDLIAAGAPLTMERRLGPGRRVRVRSGPMRDFEGTVVCRHGECRLIVSVNFLQQGASVAIEDFMLEPID
jgi:transcription antitermination factor NusG